MSVFLGQEYQYDYFYPALVLLADKYHQAFPYLNIDVNHEYENEKTLFLVACEQEDYQRMTRLYELGANIHPNNDSWGSPLYEGVDEYKRKGDSKLLNWYASIYEPLINQDIEFGGGLLSLLEPSVSDEVREMFGLKNYPLVRQTDDHQLAKQQYRLFAPNLQPVFNCAPELVELAHQMDSSSVNISAYQHGDFMRRGSLQSVSILNDMERIYRIEFASCLSDLKATFELNFIQLTIVDEFGSRNFNLSDSLSERLLDSNMKYIDLAEITEFQLSYLLLSAFIQDWIAVHDYIRDTYDYTLFSFDTYEEYVEYRGITVNDTGSKSEAECGISTFL